MIAAVVIVALGGGTTTGGGGGGNALGELPIWRNNAGDGYYCSIGDARRGQAGQGRRKKPRRATPVAWARVRYETYHSTKLIFLKRTYCDSLLSICSHVKDALHRCHHVYGECAHVARAGGLTHALTKKRERPSRAGVLRRSAAHHEPRAALARRACHRLSCARAYKCIWHAVC